MPPPRKAEESVKRHIALPRSISDDVDRVLLDPLRRKAKHGELSRLITNLLDKWLDEQEAEGYIVRSEGYRRNIGDTDV